ncbi:HD-GYP domain-containing protein [Butyrivibrio sp. WCD3002]|uniref:HD-GYP domain-containing protein n=1 Tax=Butyrivibrio sp. WCD3002 TaxID=1280676 RepID=UPI0004202C21|nr:HD-GYP domain-containing protein [Butyrivibrio sp. WCD3002]
MKRLITKKLVPGMILSDNVYSYDNNQLVLPKGTVLDNQAITKLSFYSVANVLVEDYDESIDSAPLDGSDDSYASRLRETAEFREFKKDFEICSQKFKSGIDDLINDKENFNLDEVMSPIYELMHKGNNPSNILDMLHSLRRYDDATYVHCISVAMICNIMGQWLRMSEDDIEVLTEAGLMHDIGKLLIPNEIITKPAHLTNDEYVVVQTHPAQGYMVLTDLDVSDHVKNAALMHHERCDGSGYPAHLKGPQIDYYAKIVSIADVYDAMTSARVYRDPLCPFLAIELFESEGLQKYDTNAIMTFLQNIVNTYLLNKVRLNNGQEGEIIFINRDHLSRPTVKIDSDYVDLTLHPELHIEQIL